jgi:3,4-dihydroxy 2-butanone 4-phosphate synthase/GTP cyclohydrolase II
MHAFNMIDDIQSAEKTLELHRAMEMINEEGRGAVVMLRNPSTTFISDRLKKNKIERGLTFRGYGIGAQILLDLGIQEMNILSNTERTLVGLEGYGLSIAERRPIKITKDAPVPVRDGFYE